MHLNDGIINHSLWCPPVRHIAENQSVAASDVVGEAKNFFRNFHAIGDTDHISEIEFCRIQHFHATVDSVIGTHIRNGVVECEACWIMHVAEFLAAFIAEKDPSKYQRLKMSSAFDLLALLNENYQPLREEVSSLGDNAMQIVDDATGFLRYLSGIAKGEVKNEKNIAVELNLRSGQLRTLIEALDNERLAGRPVDATAMRKRLAITTPLAKLRNGVKTLKIPKEDQDRLLMLLK